mgnify:CR=1 FL=1
MMEKEISETYSFRPVDFDEKAEELLMASLLETLSKNTNEISTVAILQNMP